MRKPLIITLVVVALVLTGFIALRGNLRKADDHLSAGNTKAASVLTITLGANSSLQADGNPTDLLSLEKLLKERSSGPTTEVVLKFETNPEYYDFMRVLELTQKAGFKRVVTQSLPGQKAPGHSP